MHKLIFSVLTVFVLLGVGFSSCSSGDDDVITLTDYREKWVGSYEGTKSNTSLDDETLTTPITFEVSINESSLTELNINGTNVPISDDGSFGPEILEDTSTNYKVDFEEDGSVTIVINEIFPNGIALPCYIKAIRN